MWNKCILIVLNGDEGGVWSQSLKELVEIALQLMVEHYFPVMG